jgi:hypothetical protein
VAALAEACNTLGSAAWSPVAGLLDCHELVTNIRMHPYAACERDVPAAWLALYATSFSNDAPLTAISLSSLERSPGVAKILRQGAHTCSRCAADLAVAPKCACVGRQVCCTAAFKWWLGGSPHGMKLASQPQACHAGMYFGLSYCMTFLERSYAGSSQQHICVHIADEVILHAVLVSDAS